MKTTEGKLRYELIPAHSLEQLALAFEDGAQKYEVDDWKKLDVETLIGAAIRHIQAIRSGEIFDIDTKVKIRGRKARVQHAGLAMAGMAMVAELLRKDIDNVDQSEPTVPGVQSRTEGRVLRQPRAAQRLGLPNRFKSPRPERTEEKEGKTE